MSEQELGGKTLLFLFYKGHSSVKGGNIHAVSKTRDDQCIEGFLRNCAKLQNVFVVGVLDCCRRQDLGQDGANQVSLDGCHNIALIYREDYEEFNQ